MLVVPITVEEAQTIIDEKFKSQISVACINSASSVTLSGDSKAILEVQALYESKNFKTRFYFLFVTMFNVLLILHGIIRLLRTKSAFHSHHMKPAYSPLLNKLQDVNPFGASVPFFSCVRGTLISGRKLNGEYWAESLLHPVQFSAAMDTAMNYPQKFDLFMEIGVHTVLKGLLHQVSGLFESKFLEFIHIDFNLFCIRQWQW